MDGSRRKFVLLLACFISVIIMLFAYSKIYENMMSDEMTTVVNVEYSITEDGVEETSKDISTIKNEEKENSYPLLNK